jgi:integrase
VAWRRRRQTVGEWLEEWLAVYIEPRVRDGELAASTAAGYRGHVRRYLIPALGKIELARLSAADVTALYLRMGTPVAEGGLGLSARTRELTHVTLRMALQRAVALGRVKRNVLETGQGVDRPRVRRRRVRALERDEAVELLRALAAAPGRDGRLFVPAMLALTTGMRRGEILALRVEDIELPPAWRPRALGMITVTRAWDAGTAAGHGHRPLERYRLREWPKSGHERYIDIPPEVVVLLREALALRSARRKAAGAAWQTQAVRADGSVCAWGELLICDDVGWPWWPDSFSSAWRTWARGSATPCRFHDLRATSGSLSLAAGSDAEVVSARLGHHSAAFFLDHYAKPLHTARVGDAAIMGALVAQAVGPLVSRGTETGLPEAAHDPRDRVRRRPPRHRSGP